MARFGTPLHPHAFGSGGRGLIFCAPQLQALDESDAVPPVEPSAATSHMNRDILALREQEFGSNEDPWRSTDTLVAENEEAKREILRRTSSPVSPDL